MSQLAGGRRGRICALAVATILAPAAIVLHEAGHFVGYTVFDFPAPELHYASAGWDGIREFSLHLRAGEFEAAQSIVAVTHSGVASAMGPLVTWVLILIGLWTLRRYESVLGAALAVAAAARVSVLLPVMTGSSEGTDEAGVSRALLIPEVPLHVLGFVVCVAGVVGSLVLLHKQGRARLMPPLVVGTALGIGLWMGPLGRLFLP
jgi:hypothetical protein